VKGDREFFVAGCDGAVAFDPAEDVFDHMAVPAKLAAEVDRRAPATAGRYAGEGVSAGEMSAEIIRIEAAVPLTARAARFPRSLPAAFEGRFRST
jgi:hypothetical protein